ncbi:MAG: DUF2335 domain-containing protein [Dehalococcoidia bacterium]|nr:DUF2335 domain-containing protein [Dehalococcoidia bacterium]
MDEPASESVEPNHGMNTPSTTGSEEENALSGESLELIQRLLRVESTWNGPIPPPAALAAFEQVQPGLADRITRMAENEQSHRHSTQRRALLIEGVRTIGGMASALVITLFSLAVAAYLIVNGHPWPGSLFGGGTLVTVVALFLATDRTKDHPEPRAKKRRK